MDLSNIKEYNGRIALPPVLAHPALAAAVSRNKRLVNNQYFHCPKPRSFPSPAGEFGFKYSSI